ncbi:MULTISPECIES: sensor histidine kinase [Winogradskyella]|uniref:tetratricopeptide repeat-containing sensor histidine kinase n=1 Tax=Winogradskyella TaxID=286104 RepID=UPI0015C94CE3|nr:MULTISPECIES: sensor histidine kinase [Winogradskyella]QXP78023.1 sensor histidine kinase [Winogradskyella sp. HaHa_3_26]
MQVNVTNIKISLCLILFPFFCFSQIQSKDSLLIIWENTKLEDALRADAYNDFITKNYFESKTDSAYAMALDLFDFSEARNLKKQKADALILLGGIEHIFGDNTKASKNFGLSLKLYKELNDIRGQANAINNLGVSYRKIYNLDEAKKYYEHSLELSKSIKDTTLIAQTLVNIGNIYGWRYKSDKAITYYEESLKLSRAIKNEQKEALALINISNSYIQKKEFEKARSYTEDAIRIGNSIGNYNILAHANNVLALGYYKQKDYDNIILAANESLFYAEKISSLAMIDGAYFFLFQAYKGKRDFDLTIKYQDLRSDQRTTIDDISTVQTLEKIKIDNHRTQDSLININNTLKLGIKHKNEKTNLVLAWGVSLLILSVLTFIVYRNSKRKQHKAKEERQQQIAEKEKLLKGLEISSINAMIRGQEKERQRIASDLHDSVGATLAAARLQFEYLMKHQINDEDSKDLEKKISLLLDNAYNETRAMAHLKNSGVMAKDGLLPAVEKLAKNASSKNELKFEVQSFGLDQRLENAIEILIFRIIQELVTNIIKHARATHAIIHLTNYENNLNIMVEDDGVGFDSKQLSKTTKGMGISSIDRRVEHLEGQLTIESEINNGTTIIIDIPV